MDGTYREEREAFLADAAAGIEEGRYGDVMALADVRLQRLPDDMDAHLVRASCRALMGRPSEAEETCEQWYEIVRDQSRVYEVLGDAYRRQGMTEEAIRSYTRFVELNPGSGEAGRVSEKIALLEDAALPQEGPALADDFHTITLARLYVKQGHYRMAADVMERILEKDPDNAEARQYASQVSRLMEGGWKPVVDELERWLSGLHRTKSA